MSYERVLAAALAETSSKFGLAEALARDIPAKKRGPTPVNERDVTTALKEAAEAITEAGGEPRAVKTLGDYRMTALWVSTEAGRNFRWVKGASFSAHSEARAAGLSYQTFRTLKPADRTVDAIRLASARRAAAAAEATPPSPPAPAAGEVAEREAQDLAGQGTASGEGLPGQPEAPQQRRKASANRSAKQVLGEACDAFASVVAQNLPAAGPLEGGERVWLASARDRAAAALFLLSEYLEDGKATDAALKQLLDGGSK